MDNRAEVREFLTTRRARLAPERAGLPAGGNRRVAGLRRAEVAMLAGVSVEYYTKIERGGIRGASAPVLDAIATALQLDDVERAHLFDLARAADGIPASGRPRRSATRRDEVRPALRLALESITHGIAFVRNAQQDLLAANALGRVFYSPVIGDDPDAGPGAASGGSGAGRGRTPNLARFQFLDPASRDFYPDWELFAAMCVDIMRAEAGRNPHDRALQDLVGELSTLSPVFRELWAAHDVRQHGAGTKRFVHPIVGEMTLAFEELLPSADPGLALILYAAEPGSPTEERMRLLGAIAAEQDAERRARAAL